MFVKKAQYITIGICTLVYNNEQNAIKNQISFIRKWKLMDYIEWANKHRDDGPHFACIHIDDIHNPEVFFTYDSEDLELIRKEKMG